MKIRASLSKLYEQWRSCGKASFDQQVSLMLGYDSDATQLVLKAFYSRRDIQELESIVELMKLSFLAMQADRSGELRVCGDSKSKSGPKP